MLRTVKFLLGLDPTYESSWHQLISQSTLPNVNEAFSRIHNVDTMLSQSSPMSLYRASFAFSTGSRGRGRGRGSGGGHLASAAHSSDCLFSSHSHSVWCIDSRAAHTLSNDKSFFIHLEKPATKSFVT